jgi:hypothetical protein
MSTRPVAPGRLWTLVAGFAVWCSALVVLYAVHAIGCAFGWSTGSLRLTLVILFFAHLAAIGWMWRCLAPGPASSPTAMFLHTAAVWALIAAVVTVIFTFGATLVLTVCV